LAIVGNSFHDVGTEVRRLRQFFKDLHDIGMGLFHLLGHISDALKNLRTSAKNTTGPLGTLERLLVHIANGAQAAYHWLNNLKKIKVINIALNIVGHVTGVGGLFKTIGNAIAHPIESAFQATPAARIYDFGTGLVHIGGEIARHFDKAHKQVYKLTDTARRNKYDFPRMSESVRPLGKAVTDVTQTVNKFDPAMKAAGRSAKEWIAIAAQAYKISLLHPQNLQDQIRYEKILAEIKKKYQGAELKGILDILKTDNAATKQKIANAQELANKTNQAAQAMADAFNNIKQQEQSAFGELFSGPYIQSAAVQNRLDWGQMLKPQDLLKDLRSQIKAFDSWNNDLERLRKRGAPGALIAQLLQMGPAAAKNVHLLTQMSRKQLGQYFDLFRTAQKDIQRRSMVEFMGQLKDWRKYGRRAAIAFMMGISDNQSWINKEMRKIFLNFLKTGQITGGHVHPARRPAAHPTHITNNHTTINAHGVDVGTVARKARLRTRRRHRTPGRP
jgi:hypothetical protein